jgi:ribosomal protein S12 methylthiotransferase accessory factor YcaO
MNQMLGVDEACDDATPAIEDEETVSWLKTATLANQPYVVPDETIAPKRREDYPSLSSADLLQDIRLCRRAVEERGMEVLVLDQTRLDVKMPVVKVIVPGLRHFWARFAPGRLYDVPVQMGWQERPLAEEDLNPIPVFW